MQQNNNKQNKADVHQFFIAQATHCNTHVDMEATQDTHTHAGLRSL